ncbi:MAG: site-specific integrase [Oscillospiraceae bacterium]|jgi:integrase|nr:site-specific integrase [Oscillospiraceae bacterium]
MRNPNGYGSVTKLSGNRRNPFWVRKTTGFDERGYPVYMTIGYYSSRETGLIALAQYNNDPWDVDRVKVTFAELYALWADKKLPKLGGSNQKSLRSAYKHCKALYALKYRTVRAYNMQECIDGCGCGYSTQSAIKALFHHLDRFALELDVITTMYSDLVTSEPVPETSKVPFTEDEINRLWDLQDTPWADSVLIYLYTGFRLSELLAVKCADVDLAQSTIKGGVKTKAGRDRIVPIHPRILPLVTSRMGGSYLLEYDGKPITKSQYYLFWAAVMERMGAAHTVHETRHTFRSRLDSAGANKVAIDRIMGHKSLDTGERVYTHKTIKELHAAVALLT